MTLNITKTISHEQRISIKPIEALPGYFDVHIESRNLQSKNPEEWRTVCKLLCQEWGLKNIGMVVWEARQ